MQINDKVLKWLTNDIFDYSLSENASTCLIPLIEATVEEIYDKFYKDLISEEEYNKILQIDPTGSTTKKGKYLDWLIRKAYRINKKLFEDSDKIRNDLAKFEKFGTRAGKQIGQIKDQYDLATVVSEFDKDIDSLKSKNEIKKEIKLKGARKVFENSDWLVLVPLTEEASCLYGRGTDWCTAYTDKPNQFENYNRQGPLYVIIDKKDETGKIQLHVETRSLMDRSDKPMNDISMVPSEALDSIYKDLEERGADEADISWFELVKGDLFQNGSDSIARYIVNANGVFYRFGLDYDNVRDSIEMIDKGKVRVRLAEFDSVEDIWDMVDTYAGKDARYSIFGEDSYQYFENDYYWSNESLAETLVNASGELKSRFREKCEELTESEDDWVWKDRFVKIKLDELEDVDDDLVRDLKQANADAQRSGTERDAYNDFRESLRDKNSFGFFYRFPEDKTENGNFELWLECGSSGLANLSEEEPPENCLEMSFRVPSYGWDGFDQEHFETEALNILK